MSQTGAGGRGRRDVAVRIVWSAWLIGFAWMFFRLMEVATATCPPSTGDGPSRVQAARQLIPLGVQCTYTSGDGAAVVVAPGYGLTGGLLLVAAVPIYWSFRGRRAALSD